MSNPERSHPPARGPEHPPRAGSGLVVARPVARPASVVVVRAPAETRALTVREEGGTNQARPLSVPGSQGTGPVDPAIDYTRPDR